MKGNLPISQSTLTLIRVREMLHYDHITGILTWLKKPNKNIVVGSRAGSLKSDGYRYLRLDNIEYMEHRLIWFGMTGNWPPKNYKIDHKDLNKSNNKWDNFRLATSAQNNMNVNVRQSNKLGVKGVRLRYDGKTYNARIQVAGKEIHIGCFATLEEAIEARNKEAYKIYGEFSKSSFKQD